MAMPLGRGGRQPNHSIARTPRTHRCQIARCELTMNPSAMPRQLQQSLRWTTAHLALATEWMALQCSRSKDRAIVSLHTHFSQATGRLTPLLVCSNACSSFFWGKDLVALHAGQPHRAADLGEGASLVEPGMDTCPVHDPVDRILRNTTSRRV
jgi:hypothetical protein